MLPAGMLDCWLGATPCHSNNLFHLWPPSLSCSEAGLGARGTEATPRGPCLVILLDSSQPRPR